MWGEIKTRGARGTGEEGKKIKISAPYEINPGTATARKKYWRIGNVILVSTLSDNIHFVKKNQKDWAYYYIYCKILSRQYLFPMMSGHNYLVSQMRCITFS